MKKEIKEEIIDTVEEYCDDDILRMYYDRERDQEAIRRGDLALAKQEAREEGSRQEKIEIAKNLLKINLSIDSITKVTGLSIDEINTIK